jgi:hypothetical protein
LSDRLINDDNSHIKDIKIKDIKVKLEMQEVLTDTTRIGNKGYQTNKGNAVIMADREKSKRSRDRKNI